MNSDMISRPVAQLELGFKSHVFDNKSFYIHIYIYIYIFSQQTQKDSKYDDVSHQASKKYIHST